jgi:uracil-DNA glycosylase
MAARRSPSTGEHSLPPHSALGSLRAAAAVCRRCELWRRGTQTVFGDGAGPARLMLVGEQPGNDEDLAGRPFVGPAGKLLDRALAEAGIDRSKVYVTNAVKHFKWEARGKRRIHAKPSPAEIAACLPWLEAELDVVKPEIIACLGATAAQALLGRQFRVTRQRGKLLPFRPSLRVVATVHPSSVLRAPDDQARALAFDQLVADLRTVARALR